MTYIAWALNTFRERIAPMLAAVDSDEPSRTWLASCWPGDSDLSKYRLYPGSLYLLWLEALGCEPSGADVRVAAALECLHNASLHHDDVLDDHDSRRGVATVRGREGSSAALLAGDGLVGLAFRLLAADERPHASSIFGCVSSAWLRMTRGQWMDEPATWQRVPVSDHAGYWEAMSRSKLALGNVAAPLAALSMGDDCRVSQLQALHEDFSIVSQIMNDVGDLEGWAGFHAVAPCSRPPGAEAAQKPTIAMIWTALQNENIRVRAEREVERRSAIALERLDAIDVAPSMKPLLLDFFTRPLAELRRVSGRYAHS